MCILQRAMLDSDSLTDADFIEAALSELEKDIIYIEQCNHVELVGDRADFDSARRDWKLLTKLNVALAVNCWSNSIRSRYSDKVVCESVSGLFNAGESEAFGMRKG